MPTPRLTLPRHRVGMHQAIGGKIFVPLQTVDSGYNCNRGDLAVGYRDRANLDDFVDLCPCLCRQWVVLYRGRPLPLGSAFYTDKLIPKELHDATFTPLAPIS